jgi:hypothetical protein
VQSLICSSFQFVVPSMALAVADRAIQAFGAEGVSQDQNLAAVWAGLRTLRIADVSLSIIFQCSGLYQSLSLLQGPDAVCGSFPLTMLDS